MPSGALTARLKLLKDNEPRWKALCGQPITDQSGQFCNGELGFVFGLRLDFEYGMDIAPWAADEREFLGWLARWGPEGTNPLHLLTTAQFYHSHMSGWPPEEWVLTHPLGLRRLDDGSYAVLTRIRTAANGRRIGRHPVPPVIDASFYFGGVTNHQRVGVATKFPPVAVPRPDGSAPRPSGIERLKRIAGGRVVIGHRARVPTVLACPNCRRRNRVLRPDWDLDYGLRYDELCWLEWVGYDDDELYDDLGADAADGPDGEAPVGP